MKKTMQFNNLYKNNISRLSFVFIYGFILSIIFNLLFIKNTFGSEMMFQPEDKQISVNGSISYFLTKITQKPDEDRYADITINLMSQYGLSSDLALKFGIGYGKIDYKLTEQYIDPTTNTPITDIYLRELKGINPLSLGLQYKIDVKKGVLFFNSLIIYGLEKHKYDSVKKTSNRTFGNLSLDLGIGYELVAGPGTLGFKFNYTLPITDKKYKNGNKENIKPTYNLTSFYELQFVRNLYGTAISIYSGSPNLAPELYLPDDKSRWFFESKFYSKIPLGKLEFLPSFLLNTNLGSTGYGDVVTYGISLGFRYKF